MTVALNPLPSLIRASAQDAGNAHMRKHGRQTWNDDDAETASKTLERLIRGCYGKVGENEPNMCFIRFSVAERMERRGAFTLRSKVPGIMAEIDLAVA